MFIFYWSVILCLTIGFGAWMGTNSFVSTHFDKALVRLLPPRRIPELRIPPAPWQSWEPIKNLSALGPSAEAYRAYVSADYPKALSLAYELAKSSGDVNAMALMGDLCLRGKGLVQNYERAYAYYQAAAQAGNRRAMHALGLMSEQGLGAEKNIQQALAWYSKAAQLGLPNSQERLGVLYLGGLNGAPKNASAAVRYLEQAASSGSFSAATRLGIIYMRGAEVTRDIRAAYNWFKQAAEEGDGKAQFYMALFHAEGFIPPKDFPQAFYWATRSAARNDDDGQYLLATLYEKGLGTRPDPAQAASWYILAASAPTPTGKLAAEANERLKRSLDFPTYSRGKALAESFVPLPQPYYKDFDAFFAL